VGSPADRIAGAKEDGVMAAKDATKEHVDEARANILRAIEAFEQIVEVMPDDVTSLEALCHAYEQLGDAAKARKHLLALARAQLAQDDVGALAGLVDRLQTHVPESTEATGLLQEVEARIKATSTPTAPAPAVGEASGAPSRDVPSAFNMAEALAYAWRLFEAKELTDAEYAKVIHDLTEMSVSAAMTTFSVLHVLEGMGHKGLDRVMNFMAKDCGTPVIALSCFDIRREAATLLPMDFMLRRGVLVFEGLGRDLLAATVNPYEKGLPTEVQALTGRRCHVFLTLPSEFDAAMNRVTDVKTEASSAKA
jgi:tetratricopeptide (TPR) repeat protein